MAVAREKGDQAKENGCEDRDPALPIKSYIHRSQPKIYKQTNTPELLSISRIAGLGGRRNESSNSYTWGYQHRMLELVESLNSLILNSLETF